MIKTELDEQPPSIKIAFLDVGQADTIVISSPDTHEAIVVDCVDPKAVLNYLTREQIKYLRGIIITHLHADHYSGVANLLNNSHQVPGMQECEVVAFNEIFNQKNLKQLMPDSDGHSSSYEQPLVGGKRLIPISLSNLFDWCTQNKRKCANLKVERRPLPFEGTLAKSLQLLHPYFADYLDLKTKSLNNTSVVLRVIGPGSNALLTGDIEPGGWQLLLANHQDLQSDVLKFPHHGAWKDADADSLLDNVKPSIVVMSVGTEGHVYNHPNPHVFSALSRHPHVRVLCTQATGQCQQLVENQRDSVVHQFRAEADKNGHELFLSKKGCPCAGTVIIELGEKAQVLQPELKFHRELIIEPHFKSHQCNIKQASAIDQVSLTRMEIQTS